MLNSERDIHKFSREGIAPAPRRNITTAAPLALSLPPEHEDE